MQPQYQMLLMCIIFILSACEPAIADPPFHAPYRWEVLVHDRLATDTSNMPARWSTIWSDGDETTALDGVIITNWDKLYKLVIENKKETVTCPNGEFPFSYSVDEISARPISGAPSRTLLGHGSLSIARNEMRMHLASCKDFTSY